MINNTDTDRNPISLRDDTGLNFAQQQNFQTLDYTDPAKVDQFLHDGEEALTPSQLPLQKNPWVRIGIAIAAAAFILGFGSMFMWGRDKSAPVAETDEPTREETLTLSLKEQPSAGTTTNEAEVDALKSQLALLQQQLAMSQIERGEEPKSEPEPNALQTRTPPKPRTARATPTTQSPARVTNREPVATPVARRTSRPVPVPSRVVPTAPSAPRPAARSALSPSTNYVPPDPQAQWLAASNTGIFGTMPAAPIAPAQPSQFIEQLVDVAPQYQLKSGSSQVSSQLVKDELTGQPYIVESVPGLYDVAPAFIPMGQMASALVSTPITWLNQDDQFVIELQEAIVDSEGYVAIPAGAGIIVQPVSINDDSGVAALAVVGAYIDGEVIALDYTTLSVKGSGGNPLIAQQYGDVGGDIASNDIEMFAIGALAGIGRELTKPDTQTATNSTFGSTISTDYGGENILGAILAGGAEQLTDRMGDRNDQRLADIRGREDIYFLAEGTEVEIYVNQEFSF